MQTGITNRDERQWNEQCGENSKKQGTPARFEVHLLVDLLTYSGNRSSQTLDSLSQELHITLFLRDATEEFRLILRLLTAEFGALDSSEEKLQYFRAVREVFQCLPATVVEMDQKLNFTRRRPASTPLILCRLVT